MVWYNLILIFSSIYVVYSLKCNSCEFQIQLGNSLPDESSWEEECTIQENDIGLCKGYIEIDYLKGDIYIWWNPITKEAVKEIASLLDVPLPLNRMQKSLIKFQFDMKFKPDESFTISAVFFCQSNDFCIVEETQRLLSQLTTLKHASSNMRKEFENLLIKSPSDDPIAESTVMCFHSFSNRIIECTSTNDAACYIGIPNKSSEMIASCTGDPDNLFVTVSYYIINPTSDMKDTKPSCSIHCNQDNCNTNEVYTRVINIAQKYISGPR